MRHTFQVAEPRLSYDMRHANCWLCCQLDFHELILDRAGAIRTEFVNVDTAELDHLPERGERGPDKARSCKNRNPSPKYWPLLQRYRRAGLGFNTRFGVAAEHLHAILINGRDFKLRKVDAVAKGQRRDRCGRVQRVARPDLICEAYAKFRKASITNKIGQHPCGHAHGQHSVREDAWITGNLRHEDLVGMDRVAIT